MIKIEPDDAEPLEVPWGMVADAMIAAVAPRGWGFVTTPEGRQQYEKIVEDCGHVIVCFHEKEPEDYVAAICGKETP